MAKTPKLHPVAAALQAIHTEVSDRFLERRAVIEAVLMAILAKEHVFILGPPGTAKSAMIREIVSRIVNAKYFEQALSKNRPDAAVLGPYDLQLLKTASSFKRKDAGFLTWADYAMLDEVGKMSPTLGHDLLSALNERVKHEVNGARSVHSIPLRSAITASNELIVQESDDAAALWDRLLVRTTVDYLQEPGNRMLLLQNRVARGAAGASGNPLATGPRTTVDLDELANVQDHVVPMIEVPINVFETLHKLQDDLRSAGITVSDRRMEQCMPLLQASAFFNGRSQVEDDDLHVLRFALWDGPEQIKPVERMTLSLSNPVAEEALAIMDDIEKISAEIRNLKGKAATARAAYGTEAGGKLNVLLSATKVLEQKCLAAGRSTSKVSEVLDRLTAVKRTVYIECLDMDPSMIR